MTINIQSQQSVAISGLDWSPTQLCWCFLYLGLCLWCWPSTHTLPPLPPSRGPGCEPRLRRVEAPPHFVPQLSDSVHNGLPRLGERSRADASPPDVVKRARGPSVPYTALLAPQTQYASAHVPAQGGTPRRAANFCPSLSLPTEKQTEAEIGRQQQPWAAGEEISGDRT